MTTSSKSTCKAKNPSTCPYHGDKAQIVKAQKKLDSLFNRTKVKTRVGLAPEINHLDVQEFTAIIRIKPVSKQAKSSYNVKIVSATFDGLMGKLANQNQDELTKHINPNLKNGYIMEVYAPFTSDSNQITNYSHNHIESIKEITDVCKNVAEESTFYNNDVNKALDELRDSKKAQTSAGVKGVALISKMGQFHFFSNYYIKQEVESAFHSIVNNHASEYTNRTWGIRIHPDFDSEGELLSANFSLDYPNKNDEAFNQNQVNEANAELKNYFTEVNKNFNKN